MPTPAPGSAAPLSAATQTSLANQIIALAEVVTHGGRGALAKITALDIIALAESLRCRDVEG